MSSVPAFTPAPNEADKMAPAIESVQRANKVLVIDTDCTGDTLDITRGSGCRIEPLAFGGWGHETSDPVARLFQAGIQRCDLRSSPAWHLWRLEADRRRVPENDQPLCQCPEQKRTRAIGGIGKLEEEEA